MKVKSEELNPIYDKVWKTDFDLALINPAQKHRRRLTKKILKKIVVSSKSILDIGCGTGELLSEVSSVFPGSQLYGCDISGESGQLLSKISSTAKFYCIDVQKENKFSEDLSFNLITCCEMLEHCENDKSVVKNAFNWLTSEGTFFLSVPSGNMTQYDKLIGHKRHYKKEEVIALLKEAGFSKINCIYWGAPFHSLYRIIVTLGTKNMDSNENRSKSFMFLYKIFCSVFNILFYLNFLKDSGKQIFAWGYKN